MISTLWQQTKHIFRAAFLNFQKSKTPYSRHPIEQDVQSSPGSETVDVLGTSSLATLHGSVVTSSNPSLTRGKVVAGRFEIVRFLNCGGMGEVYEAWDSELREHIALKTIRPEIAANPAIIDRFKREVRQARVISHENVCRVYEVFSHAEGDGERVWFLTMELLKGQTLSERLQQRGPVREEEAIKLIDQMIAGLAAAHAHGIVHRDFKSSNVMLIPTEHEDIRVIITDFGLSLNILKTSHSLFER